MLSAHIRSERIAAANSQLIEYDGKNEMAIHAIIHEWPLRKLRVNA